MNREGRSPRVFAIYVTLADSPFIEASLESVYPFAARIFVLTGHDRTWDGSRVAPDSTLDRVIDFPDPDSKICVIKMWCPDEALARNWVMHAAQYPAQHEIRPQWVTQEEIDRWIEPPDYFWIVDGDEIYDPDTVPDILDYVYRSGANELLVWSYVYFKSWNYRVEEPQPFTAFVKAGRYFETLRSLRYPRILRYLNAVPRIGPRVFNKIVGRKFVPIEVGYFHHPAYVGGTERIARKLQHSGHRSAVIPRWVEDVWEKWTPETTDFHPTLPSAFHRAVYVPDEELPRIITRRTWPTGFTGKIE